MLAHVVATTTEEIVASLPRKALATGHFLVFGPAADSRRSLTSPKCREMRMQVARPRISKHHEKALQFDPICVAKVVDCMQHLRQNTLNHHTEV